VTLQKSYSLNHPQNDLITMVGDTMALKEETATLIGLLSLALGFVLKEFTNFGYSGFSISAFVGGRSNWSFRGHVSLQSDNEKKEIEKQCFTGFVRRLCPRQHFFWFCGKVIAKSEQL
jgi:hypothetical protein